MASKFTELCVDALDPHALARFWAGVLGYEETESTEHLVELTGATGPAIVFVRVPEKKTVKNRLHIDVNAIDRDQAAEVERIKALGARETDVGQGDVSWVVLSDPEGNEFCVLRSRVQPD